MSSKPVLIVTIKFKKRGVLPNEFSVRLSATDFDEKFSVDSLIKEGYAKHQQLASPVTSWLTRIPQKLFGFGRYIGFRSRDVIAVYTEKDKGRISLDDTARYVLVNNEVKIILF
jgi:hypothetical protein